jgi:DNA polymerase III subunit epsilon
MAKVFWFDTETTGLSSLANDIVQLAYIVEIDGEVDDEGEFYISPPVGAEIQEAALQVHGKNRELIQTYPSQRQFMQQFLSLLDSYVDKYDKGDKFIAAGYNVSFDLDMLRGLWTKQGQKYFGSYFFGAPLDVLCFVAREVIEGRLPTNQHKLGIVCKHYGVEIDAHDAASDIKATRELYLKIGASK